MSNTERRVTQRGTVLMFDMEGNEYRVAVTQTEIRQLFSEGWSQWMDDQRSLRCGQGPVNQLPDGSFQIALTGTQIYPRSRLPGTKPE